MKILLMLITLSFQNTCFATMFNPIALEAQVEEATAAVEVYLNSSKVFKNALGAIMTEYSFDVLESFNLSNDEIENNKLKLTLPGGTFKDTTSMIDGAPNFNVNEKSFLLLKKIESSFYLSNFSLGKFRIEENHGEVFYVSDLFPQDPAVGRIEKNKMIKLMEEKWNISFSDELKVVTVTDDPTSQSRLFSSVIKTAHKRSPAQALEEKQETPLFFWSAIVIVILSFSFVFLKLSKNESEKKDKS